MISHVRQIFITAFIALLLSFPALAASNSFTEEEIRKFFTVVNAVPDSSNEIRISGFCRGKWNNNFEMVQHCRDHQTKAMNGIKRLYILYKDELSKKDKFRESELILMDIALSCHLKWSYKHASDWEMIKYCNNKQLDAYSTNLEIEMKYARQRESEKK